MYSEQDLRDAVAGGAITEEAALALRAHVAKARHMPITDEENFRLVSSFNDIFVAIGVVIMLLAMGAVGQAIAEAIATLPEFPDWATASEEQWTAYRSASEARTFTTFLIGGLFVAGTAWALAEFFTRRRRMALPSILLLLGFIGALFFTGLGAVLLMQNQDSERVVAIAAAIGGVLAAAGAYMHWRRFMVPITIAAGAAAIALTALALIAAAIDPATEHFETIILSLVFVAGLAIFAVAMRWDMSDRERKTRRSDVAFWLHLLAAPMIAHPIFALLGVIDGSGLNVAASIGVLAVYVLFGIIALAIDRRALLVSALFYVLIALGFLFDRFGAVELTFALTALVIGSALLTLSAFWVPIREKIVAMMPGGLQDRLPTVGPIGLSA